MPFFDSYLNSWNKLLTYTVSEAKNKLPQLIKQAEAGDRVTITKRGVAMVEIVRKADVTKRKRAFGGFEKEIKILDPDWARPQNDIDAWLQGDV